MYRVRHYQNREKIRSKNGLTEKERIVWLRVKQKKKKKKKERERASVVTIS